MILSPAELQQAGKLAYSVDELAAATGISRDTIYALWRQGRGPVKRKIGSRTIITRRDAEEWLQSI